MVNQEFPRQHRKKRLPLLHVRRIPGRVDTDTFYSSVKSKQKYNYTQLFACIESKFVFARCLQPEKQFLAAFQDFVREVGAPSLLCSDNFQTQTGEKWTATCRELQITQITTASFNQNQNYAKRSIQDIKHNVIQILYFFIGT